MFGTFICFWGNEIVMALLVENVIKSAARGFREVMVLTWLGLGLGLGPFPFPLDAKCNYAVDSAELEPYMRRTEDHSDEFKSHCSFSRDWNSPASREDVVFPWFPEVMTRSELE